MRITKTKTLTESQFEQINQMWNEEYPMNLIDRFPLLLDGVEFFNHYLIEKENVVLAWAVDFFKDNETRFSIIVGAEQKHKGYGTLLMNRLKLDLGEFSGWVIDHNNDQKMNGEVYQSPVDFYLKVGLEILPQERIDNEMISAVKMKFKARPIVETERLFLREIIAADLEPMFEMDSDPEVHRYLGNSPVTEKTQIEEVIGMLRKQYELHGIARWAVVDKNTNEFLGWSGLKYITEPINNRKHHYDLGYRLLKKHWRRGIATETALATLDYAFKVLKTDAVYACADCDNEGSNKILTRIGFQRVETFLFDDIPCFWYEIGK